MDHVVYVKHVVIKMNPASSIDFAHQEPAGKIVPPQDIATDANMKQVPSRWTAIKWLQEWYNCRNFEDGF